LTRRTARARVRIGNSREEYRDEAELVEIA
jgi:hypothetical protein